MGVRNYTDKELLSRVQSLPSFKGWPEEGVLDIWVRSKVDEFNKFDDKVYSFNCFGETKLPEFAMVCSGTSNAGQYGLEHYEEYNSVGCAVLKSDVIVYNSHVPGLHKGKPAYIQSFTVGFPYFRDSDKDKHAEEIGKEYHDRIGANCHSAGEASVNIDNWSVACLVRNIKLQFNKWLKFMANRPLTVAIIKET